MGRWDGILTLSQELFNGKRYTELNPEEIAIWRNEWLKRKDIKDPTYKAKRRLSSAKWARTHREQINRNFRKRYKALYEVNRPRYKKAAKKHKEKMINEFFLRYGNSCFCCGETNRLFLTIEHLNGDGAQHRKRLGRESADSIIRDIKKQGWPDGYATLCMNCNFAKWRNNGICPHEQEVKKIVLGVVA
jgi:hypothetical protein